MPAMPAMLSSMVRSIKPAVEARGFNGMGPVSLYLAIKDYLKDANAYVCPPLQQFDVGWSANDVVHRIRPYQTSVTSSHQQWQGATARPPSTAK